jgi:hypothetical protein
MNAWLVVPDGDFSQIDALGLECPLWVKSGHQGQLNERPLYSQKRTCRAAAKPPPFDHLVGEREQLVWNL